MHWVREQVEAYGLSDKRTLEVGSLNVNGSVREFFTGEYIGTDMREGPGVDLVVNAHDLCFADGDGFEVIVSTEMLEHDDAPWESLAAMRSVATPGAHLFLTCRGYDERGCFPLHDFPSDLWRFSCEGVYALLERTGWTVMAVYKDPEFPGVFAHARA
jgi:SAM-dependent methyltransferase